MVITLAVKGITFRVASYSQFSLNTNFFLLLLILKGIRIGKNKDGTLRSEKVLEIFLSPALFEMVITVAVMGITFRVNSKFF